MRDDDRVAVEALLGRPPRGPSYVVVRDGGRPVVLRTPPNLPDGTPMPTLYWLVGQEEHWAVSRLEAGGGVKQAESAVAADLVAAAHGRYAAERGRAADPDREYEHAPSGGVGGTHEGVKCLHAHLAYHLAGGDDPIGRHTAELLGLDTSRYLVAGAVGAVDCGTNSTRLLVLAPDGERLDRRMVITRLGEGVDGSGRLDAGAIERTLAVLSRFRAVMDHHGVRPGDVRATATSAAREAANLADFLDPAEEILGSRPEVIGGEDEGRLSFLGATEALDRNGGPYVVVDVGGGSTELIAGSQETAGAPVALLSMDTGCVRVTERHLDSDPPPPGAVEAARREVREMTERAIAASDSYRGARQLVGLAGTVSQLTVLALGLDGYDGAKVHHARLARSSVDEWAERLASLTVAERRAIPGMEPARADVILGGAIVLGEVMSCLGYESLLVSEADILDGVALELLRRH